MKAFWFWLVLLLIVIAILFGGQLLVYIGNAIAWLGKFLTFVKF